MSIFKWMPLKSEEQSITSVVAATTTTTQPEATTTTTTTTHTPTEHQSIVTMSQRRNDEDQTAHSNVERRTMVVGDNNNKERGQCEDSKHFIQQQQQQTLIETQANDKGIPCGNRTNPRTTPIDERRTRETYAREEEANETISDSPPTKRIKTLETTTTTTTPSYATTANSSSGSVSSIKFEPCHATEPSSSGPIGQQPLFEHSHHQTAAPHRGASSNDFSSETSSSPSAGQPILLVHSNHYTEDDQRRQSLHIPAPHSNDPSQLLAHSQNPTLINNNRTTIEHNNYQQSSIGMSTEPDGSLVRTSEPFHHHPSDQDGTSGRSTMTNGAEQTEEAMEEDTEMEAEDFTSAARDITERIILNVSNSQIE